MTAVVALLVSIARGAVDPGAATAPRTDFVPPPAGTYQLQRIQQAGDAALLDSSGRARRLAEFTHGKITLLTFFYTSCPDPLGCPFGYVILSQLRQLVQADAALAARVRFVDISLDPVHDTPAALQSYARQGSSPGSLEWSFLTAASVTQLLPVLDDFGQDVSVGTDSQGRRQLLHHMLKVFLIDPQATVREIYSLAYLQPQVMLNDIRTLRMEHAGASAATLAIR
jgi:protein SCO1